MRARRPIHTAYVGAHLFRAGLAREWGAIALKAISDHASDLNTLANEAVWSRVRAKLQREPIEDLRIDFEDGFGDRSAQEEDATARATAVEVATAMASASLPPFLGIRIKAGAPGARGARTLELFLTSLVERSGGKLPRSFAVTLPKVMRVDEVTELVHQVEELESRLHLEAALAIELMVETPQAIVGPDGRCPLPALVAAARGRCRGVHFGVYDYSAALGLAPAHHGLRHPACDHARHIMQVALAGSGVELSAGSTNVLPVPPRENVVQAWRLHFEDVRHALVSGFYHGWDLHPAQLVTRYAAVFTFFGECLDGAAPAANVLEDPAATRVRADLLERARDCGAIPGGDAT